MQITKEQVRCIKCGNSLDAYHLKERPLNALIVRCKCGCNQVYFEPSWREVE